MNSNNKGFTLVELLSIVVIIGVLSVIGITAYIGFSDKAKKNVVISNHNMAVDWLKMKAIECEGKGTVSYHDWQNKYNEKTVNCIYSNAWHLINDLGYNNFRLHFLAEYQYNKKYLNPWHSGDYTTNENPSWGIGCGADCPNYGNSRGRGATCIYGDNLGAFWVWTNLGNGDLEIEMVPGQSQYIKDNDPERCLESRIQFPVN